MRITLQLPLCGLVRFTLRDAINTYVRGLGSTARPVLSNSITIMVTKRKKKQENGTVVVKLTQ